MAKGDVEVSGVPSPEFIGVDWELTNTVSPSAAGLSSEGYGQLSATAQPGVDDEFVIDRDVTVTFSKDEPDVTTNEPIPFGSVEGWVSGYSTYGLVADDLMPETRGPASITITPNLAILNVDRDAPAVVNVSLSEAFQTYVELVTSSLPVSYEATNNPIVSFPGWSGNVWEYVSNLAAIKGVELTYTGDGLVVRDLQVDALEQEFMGDPSYQFTEGSSGQYVEVAYQDQTVISSLESNFVNYSENPSLEVSGTGWSAEVIPSAQYGVATASNGSGRVVLVGGDSIAWSDDGLTWTRTRVIGDDDDGGLLDVIWGNGGFIAVGYLWNSPNTYTPLVLTSVDGETWDDFTITVDASNYLTSVIWDGSRYLALGVAVVGAGVSEHRVYESTDGENWSEISLFYYSSYYLGGLCYANNVYVLGSSGLESYYSYDAETWIAASNASGGTQIATNGSIFVCAGSSITTSTDGTVWTVRSPQFGDSVVWDGTHFVVTSTMGVYTSVDGITWSTSSLSGATGPFSWTGSVYASGQAIGYNRSTWKPLPTYDASDDASIQRANNSSRAYRGNYSQQVHVTIPSGGVMPSANETLSLLFTTPTVDVSQLAGHSATVGVFVRSTNTSGYFASSISDKRLVVRFYTSSSTFIETAVGYSGGGTGFAVWSGLVPANAATAEIQVDVDFTARSGSPSVNSNATNTYLNADAQFVVLGTGGTYFDGDTPGATWVGTPGLSPSEMPNPNNIPLYDAYLDNNRILEVAAGEVQEFVLESNVWATDLVQPIPSTLAPVGVGNYHVIDSQGVPCTGAFVGLGGDVTVAINDLGQIVATLTGPSAEASINSGPYRLASFDGQTTRGEFRIAGTGIITDQKTVRVPTGADPTRFAEDVAYSITYPFVNTPAEAYTVGFATGAYASAAYPEVGFNFYTDGMPAWNYAAGKYFDYNGSRFRILSASVNPGSTGVSAQQRNTWDEVKSVHSGKTYGDLAAEWGSLRYRDNIIKPRKEV